MRAKSPTYTLSGLLPIVLLLVGLGLAGCATTRVAEDVEDVSDTEALISHLHKQGIEVDRVGFVAPIVLTQAGEKYRLLGSGVLHVYEYTNEEAAQSDINKLGSRISTSAAEVYHRGNLLVAYFGTSTDVKLTLAQVLGARLT